MSPEEKGAYCSIIFYLYANGGSLCAETKSLSRLCNCDSVEHFDKIWKKLKHKFFKKRGKIFHKKVSRELSRKAKLIQLRSEAGVKGAKARWQTDDKTMTKPDSQHSERKGKEANRNEEKGREIISNRQHNQNSKESINAKDFQTSKDSSIKFSSSFSSTRPDSKETEKLNPVELKRRQLILYDVLQRELGAAGPANVAALRNFVNWLVSQIKAGVFDNEKIWMRVGELAEQSIGEKIKNPPAMFMSKVKAELGYLKDE
jgi:uncharacterized protein YdaU (DUF1376 family)